MSSSKNIGLFKIPEKIVVVGDIHADYETLLKTLKYAGLINKKLEWTGKKTHLIVIGDLVDGKNRVGDWTNDSDIKVIHFLEKLMGSASKTGGKVVILLGNHEFMNMSGNFSYSGIKGTNEMGGENGRAKYFRGEFKQFAKKCYLAVQYDDWIFCHAGIAPEISKKYSIHDLNTMLFLYLDNRMSDEIKEKFVQIISGPHGILTTREFGMDNVDCSRLNKTLANYRANHMVVGHTVQKHINSMCNHKLWRVDVGLSRAFGEKNKKRISSLLISDHGKKTKILT
jgi:hypothetical protein